MGFAEESSSIMRSYTILILMLMLMLMLILILILYYAILCDTVIPNGFVNNCVCLMNMILGNNSSTTIFWTLCSIMIPNKPGLLIISNEGLYQITKGVGW